MEATDRRSEQRQMRHLVAEPGCDGPRQHPAAAVADHGDPPGLVSHPRLELRAHLAAAPLVAPGVDGQARMYRQVADAQEPGAKRTQVDVIGEEARDHEHEPAAAPRDAYAPEQRIGHQHRPLPDGEPLTGDCRPFGWRHSRIPAPRPAAVTGAPRDSPWRPAPP